MAVTIDEDRITRVNGRPFFPIAARHIPLGADNRLLAEAGFNAVRWMAVGGDKFERDWVEPPSDLHRLMFYAYVYNRADFSSEAEARRKDLRRVIDAVRNHPQFLVYEQRNEPAGAYRDAASPKSLPEGMIAGSQLIRQLDPHHPISIGHLPWNLVSTLRRYNSAVDIVGCNPYVVTCPGMRQNCGSRPDGRMVDSADQSLSSVGLHVDKMMRVAEGRAVWMQVQGASNENWYNPDYTPEQKNQGLYEHLRLNPNHWQMRFMAYQAIVRGATGLTWMLYGLSVESSHWTEVVKLIRELRALHDVLASPTWPGTLQVEYTELGFSDWTGVQTVVKTHEGRPWILAANSQFDPMIGTFSNLPEGIGDELQVFGEKRTVRIEGGRFTDRFQPYEVHVYGPIEK